MNDTDALRIFCGSGGLIYAFPLSSNPSVYFGFLLLFCSNPNVKFVRWLPLCSNPGVYFGFKARASSNPGVYFKSVPILKDHP